MAFNDISLTAGMRSNLIGLQGTVNLINRTQERLSSGKKVNSALDNPTSFFAAQGLNQRASDLAALKDGMGQAIQTVKAADSGIKGITTLIEAARGIAQAALGSSDVATVTAYATQYDAILGQIDFLAADSGYKGTNLLNGDDLTVSFNEDNSSNLAITGITADSATLLVTVASGVWVAGGVVVSAEITNSLADLDVATTTLRDNSATLSSNLAVVNARLEFTSSMVSTLTEGADKLVLADMNEEGANMLMLQTRQSLGTSALSMSAQAAQSVLRLFQ
ncbi:MAG: flagellin [Deltaproteobacteria bacterium]|nr:flagellin [Deltaproteobacteria bacterium]